jgi:hypothetical protein
MTMDTSRLKMLHITVPIAFDERITKALAARRLSPSKPIFTKSAAVREALSEWLDRQAA